MGPAVSSGRFAVCVAGQESTIALDEMALLIATQAHPGLDLDAELARLDALALGCAADPESLARHLVAGHGFRGDATDYQNPANSFLDDVITRRCGIPITLSVLMIAIGRRIGVRLVGIGMPGHFMVATATGDAAHRRYFDLFSDATPRTARDCHAQFVAAHPGAEFEARFLEPVGPRVIARRMLANLEQSFAARDPSHLVWVTELALTIPDTPRAERHRLAARLGDLGAYHAAATALDQLADESADSAESEAARRLRVTARAQRARGN